MTDKPVPLAINAADAPLRTKASNYPEPFASRVSGRHKRPLGDIFGLTSFGVNHTVLDPGAESALLHIHSKADELVYVLSGTATLVTDDGEMELSPGMCAGFAAAGRAHHIVNRSSEPVTLLEIGDRTPGDSGSYPNDDLMARMGPNGWEFLHKDGTPY